MVRVGPPDLKYDRPLTGPDTMLWESKDGEYFRGEEAPSEDYRFLMSDEELDRIGRIMAGILRHFPDRFDLTMDSYGWVDIRDMVRAIRNQKRRMHWLRPHHIKAIVDTDDKGRYQIDGGMVRATYAHSIDVVLDDLPVCQEETLYFPVDPEELDDVLEGGLHPTDRKKLHLSGTWDNAYSAGRVRLDRPVVLKIDAAAAMAGGAQIYQAGKSVFVAEDIDPEFLSVAEEPEEEVAVE